MVVVVVVEVVVVTVTLVVTVVQKLSQLRRNLAIFIMEKQIILCQNENYVLCVCHLIPRITKDVL